MGQRQNTITKQGKLHELEFTVYRVKDMTFGGAGTLKRELQHMATLHSWE